MPADVRSEAAFQRGALLIGLIHERHVHDWAESLLHSEPGLATTIADILSTPAELSAMREALWPLPKDVDPRRVGMALLTAMFREDEARPADARVRMLGQIRTEFTLPPQISQTIKRVENRQMFAAAGITTVTAPTAAEIGAFLEAVVHNAEPS